MSDSEELVVEPYSDREYSAVGTEHSYNLHIYFTEKIEGVLNTLLYIVLYFYSYHIDFCQIEILM